MFPRVSGYKRRSDIKEVDVTEFIVLYRNSNDINKSLT
jgi:hypothetical protein